MCPGQSRLASSHSPPSPMQRAPKGSRRNCSCAVGICSGQQARTQGARGFRSRAVLPVGYGPDERNEDPRRGLNPRGTRCANPYCDSDGLRALDLHLDHRIPRVRGGEGDQPNRIRLCGNRNTRKGAKAWGLFLDQDAPGSHARQWGNDTSVVRKHVENQRARGILRQGVRAKFPYPEHPCLISTPRTGFPTLPPGHVHFSHRQPTGPCRAAQRGSRRRARWPAGRWPSSCGADASGRTMLPMAASLVASTWSAIGGQ